MCFKALPLTMIHRMRNQGEAFGLTCWLTDVRLLVGLSCVLWRTGGKPTAFRRIWQRYRSWGHARAQIRPTLCLQNVIIYKNSFPHAHMSEVKRSGLMRRLYLTGLKEMGVYLRRGLEPLQDCYPCETNTVWLKDG